MRFKVIYADQWLHPTSLAALLRISAACWSKFCWNVVNTMHCQTQVWALQG
jgi:hypothetical protein